VTQYDILRTFSCGSSPVYAVEMPGSLLAEILDFGFKAVGSGSYLLTTPNVAGQAGAWWISGEPLVSSQTYRVAMADDLLHDYLFLINEKRAKEALVVGVYADVGKVLIDRLQATPS
jgi:hypothetical protein